MKKKYIDGHDLDPAWLLAYRSVTDYLDRPYKAYISLIEVEDVQEPIPVDYDLSGKCLVDKGYKVIIYMPLSENWCVSVFFDTHDQIVEWYFDMTQENTIENGRPYFIDLYLDLAVSAKDFVAILDGDELQEALDQGVIDDLDYEKAYDTCQHLINKVIRDKAFMRTFFHSALDRLRQGGNNA